MSERNLIRLSLDLTFLLLVVTPAFFVQLGAASECRILDKAELAEPGIRNMLESWALPSNRLMALETDLDGDGREDVVIAGSGNREEQLGFIAILWWNRRSPIRSISWYTRVGRGGDLLGDVTCHNLDGDENPEILVTFGDLGSTYAATTSYILFSYGVHHDYLALDTPGGPIQIKDLDGDGIEEVIVQHFAREGITSSCKLFWCDVFRWTGFGLEKANEEFPDFYSDQIKDYYQKNIESYDQEKYQHSSCIEANRELIRRAQEIIDSRHK